MGQSARTGQTPRGVIIIDWMVVCSRGALLFFIRLWSGHPWVDPTADGGGLRPWGRNDGLLASQDFSFPMLTIGTPRWSAMICRVLHSWPFDNDAVQLAPSPCPLNARTAVKCPGVHMVGEWSGEGPLSIALGDAEPWFTRTGRATPRRWRCSPDAEGVGVRMSYHSITYTTGETASRRR
jgi:hypothetical protein